MYNTAQLYELSFALPPKGSATRARLVFTITAEYLDEISRRLHIIAGSWSQYSQEYCYPGVRFSYPTPDLFGKMEFGYGKCGFVSVEDGLAQLNIEIGGGDRLRCCTLTIKLLTQALAVSVEGAKSNQLQQVDLEMRCDLPSARGYEHALTGYLSTRVTAWLCEQGKKCVEGRDIRVPKEVLAAMRYAWKSVCMKGHKHWAKDVEGRITADGRFSLECFGNACDIAIYPDTLWGERVSMEEPFVRFECHNLDTAAQQITLLAGLAKLCELARANESLS